MHAGSRGGKKEEKEQGIASKMEPTPYVLCMIKEKDMQTVKEECK